MEITSPAPEELERRDPYRLEETLACDEHEAHCGACGRQVADIEFLTDPECPNGDCETRWQCVALRGDSPNHASHLNIPEISMDDIIIEAYDPKMARGFGKVLTLRSGVVHPDSMFYENHIIDPLGRVR